MTIIARHQNNELKQLFHIKSEKTENVLQVLSLRLGENHASFAITDKTGNELYELAYGSMGGDKDELAYFFNKYPSLQNSFYRVLIAYDHPQSILTPSAIYQPETAGLFLNASYGIMTGSDLISELISEWQLYNTYTVPLEQLKWIRQKFPAARSWHQYSLTIKKLNAAGNAGQLLVDFRTDDFTLLVAKDSKLVLAQCFSYTTPGDVLYYLLKTCRQFSLSQKDVDLQLTGLIDKNSALYNELYLYFMNVQFRRAGWDTGADYPVHFFTSLNDLAQCAS